MSPGAFDAIGSVSLADLILRQARARPNAIAVSEPGGAVCYGELDAQASALAAYLGEASGTAPVGILDDRGGGRVAAILGCMLSGRAYVPLDPALPEARIAAIAAHAGLSVIVAPTRANDMLPPLLRRNRIGMKDLQIVPPHPFGTPCDAPFYLLYTSGSTGEPKGVAMPEGPIRNLVLWQAETLPLAPGARVLQFAPLGFDVASQEILTTLAAGGELVLSDEMTRRNPRKLMELIATRGIERVFLPVHALRMIAEQGAACPDTLRDVIAAGEALTITPAIEQFFAQGNCRLHNHYGPTETHVVSSHTLSGDPADWPRRVPIGAPIAEVEITLCDAALARVSQGANGEICILGSALADGYYADPGNTALRFVHDPETGRRMFRTGDIGRFGPNGLEYIGRADRQLKLRGIRVELDAVEAALCRTSQVAFAAVAPPGGTEDGLRAFVVPSGAARAAAAKAVRRARLGQAKFLWDGVYDAPVVARDPSIDTRGWIESAHRRHFSEAEIGDWADATSARIRAIGARSILDIGCGGGMLATRLLPDCEIYVGTDISSRALTETRVACESIGLPTDRLILACQPADMVLDLDEGTFDCVVLNSVVELFPDRAYLLAVLEAAIRQTTFRGKVFVGDVRNLALMKLFHTAVERKRATPDTTAEELSQRVAQAAKAERRLFVDPIAFHCMAQDLPRVTGIETELRRDRHSTEMSRYRYDVILHLDSAPRDERKVHRLDWSECPPLRELSSHCPEDAVLCVSGIPNKRLAKETAFAADIQSAAKTKTIDSLGHAAVPATHAVAPESLWALAGEGLDTRVAFTPGCPWGSLSLWMSRVERYVEPVDRFSGIVPDTNDPLALDIERHLASEIRRELRVDLPEPMVPGEIRILDEMPLTRSGKIDRSALEAKVALAPVAPAPPKLNQPPESGSFALIAESWREVLGQDNIDPNLGFFDHGGTSMLLVELFLILDERLPGGIEFMALVRYPTVNGLVAYLEQADSQESEIHALHS